MMDNPASYGKEHKKYQYPGPYRPFLHGVWAGFDSSGLFMKLFGFASVILNHGAWAGSHNLLVCDYNIKHSSECWIKNALGIGIFGWLGDLIIILFAIYLKEDCSMDVSPNSCASTIIRQNPILYSHGARIHM